jgi:hypothetical protein
MNCKPGDLAIVVSVDGHPLLEHLLGSIRRVKKVALAWDGPAWTYSGRRFRAAGQTCHAIPDRWLRPIRDPGDDAKDESFRWAPAPEKVLA